MEPTTPVAPATTEPTTPTAPEPTPFPMRIGDPDPEPTPPALSPEQQQLADMKQQFDSFKEEATARETRLSEQLSTLMNQPRYTPPAAPAAPAGPPAPTLDDLPDPVQNPTEFNAKLKALLGHRDQQAQSQQQLLQQQSRAQVVNNLWNRLQGLHPEYASKSLLAQAAASAEFAELNARGVDFIQAATANPDGLVASIVARMQKEIGQQAPTTPAGPTAPAAPVAPTMPATPRTDGFATGTPMLPPTAPVVPTSLGFTAQLNDARAKDGLV